LNTSPDAPVGSGLTAMLPKLPEKLTLSILMGFVMVFVILVGLGTLMILVVKWRREKKVFPAGEYEVREPVQAV
jgi:hypothetical protein